MPLLLSLPVSLYTLPAPRHLLPPPLPSRLSLQSLPLEQLVFSIASQRFKEAPVSGPSTIRLFFHDCFVDGCDASILISGRGTVREAFDNRNLAVEAFETVNRVKAVLEANCLDVVSLLSGSPFPNPVSLLLSLSAPPSPFPSPLSLVPYL
ncbi:Peroxidase 19 [Nymphaea thermarum]|nr:Peroxidase 19 [Nymphaea thermarum]